MALSYESGLSATRIAPFEKARRPDGPRACEQRLAPLENQKLLF
jgi:hypothetical protein